MYRSISKILVAMVVLLSFTACEAQIKDAKTATVKIYGNCDMCKETIEKAGNSKKLAKVDWNTDTKMATFTYDAQKTNPDEILKRIALAGYDSDKFLAPDEAYSKLPECCQYKREVKPVTATAQQPVNPETPKPQMQEKNELQPVFERYFSLKDALVKTDGNNASERAKELVKAIGAVKMGQLETDTHMVWMKVMASLKEHAEHIADTKDIQHQRDHFMDLSQNIHDLVKASKLQAPVYYQFCPMANNGKGAHWLSKENAIKNPYYGAKMMTCGKTVETIR
ncbi:DUF3347 domain-containing protein [Flavobacterium humi]|uniref:DUF3347 domain-containing protein n=1 Tax=Flavobacterium humi TaxID=2562683 RepID=A0A4Z0L466_9FLAO|nr:DUF3347 domain-containing protein [Flavobacterium humi]TGD57047.1 DUF3347 domain-containing protein [Flavobacterium humi]